MHCGRDLCRQTLSLLVELADFHCGAERRIQHVNPRKCARFLRSGERVALVMTPTCAKHNENRGPVTIMLA